MTKTICLITLLLGTTLHGGNIFAEGELNKIIEKKEERQSSAKKSRRKKVLMCNECGKPETECTCEGHGNDEHIKKKK